MPIDGSIIQFRDQLNGDAKVYPLTYQNAVLGEDNQPLQTYITEYNVSQHHTNTVGNREVNPNYDTSVFTLSDAIATVPDDYKRGGLKLSFNSDSGNVESYTLDSSVWKNDVNYWKQFDVDKLVELSQQMIYDVTANNSGATFASLSALLSSENLSTLIPITARCGGMIIRFVKSSDNKYVQYRLMSDTFNTTPANWQGVDDEPIAGSNNLITSGAVANVKTKTDYVNFVNEDGLFITDEEGNVGIKYNEDGFDVAKLNSHIQSLIKLIPGWLVIGETATTAFAGNRGRKLEDDLAKLVERLGIVDTMEDGLYFTDENLYVGASIDAQGFHTINVLEYEIN